MKKVFIAGMAMVVASTMVSNAFAAGAVVAKPKAVIAVEKMEKTARDTAFGKDKTAKDVASADIDKTITALAEWLKPGTSTELKAALKSDPSKLVERLDNLALAYATKEVAKKVTETDADLGKSLSEYAETQVEIISISQIVKSGAKAKNLSADDNTAALKGFSKFESEGPAQAKTYSKAELDSWNAVKKEAALNVRIAKFDSPAEALVQALMTKVTNGDRAKAIEIMRKLADCV